MNTTVEVRNITKKYGSLTAVDNINLNVEEGDFFGFLGPNGAGKTTLIRMLTTLIKPTNGDAKVARCDIRKDPKGVRNNCNDEYSHNEL
ncbi:MAG: ATP-binding cassette domain-containing protein [bacterium]